MNAEAKNIRGPESDSTLNRVARVTLLVSIVMAIVTVLSGSFGPTADYLVYAGASIAFFTTTFSIQAIRLATWVQSRVTSQPDDGELTTPL